jgi:hypothetical protein
VTLNVYDISEPVKLLIAPLERVISPPVKSVLASLSVTVTTTTCPPLIVDALPGVPTSKTVGGVVSVVIFRQTGEEVAPPNHALLVTLNSIAVAPVIALVNKLFHVIFIFQLCPISPRAPQDPPQTLYIEDSIHD